MPGIHFDTLKQLTSIMMTCINYCQQLIKVNGLREPFKHCSIAVFPKHFLLADHFWLKKITSDPLILADINRMSRLQVSEIKNLNFSTNFR